MSGVEQRGIWCSLFVQILKQKKRNSKACVMYLNTLLCCHFFNQLSESEVWYLLWVSHLLFGGMLMESSIPLCPFLSFKVHFHVEEFHLSFHFHSTGLAHANLLMEKFVCFLPFKKGWHWTLTKRKKRGLNKYAVEISEINYCSPNIGIK